MAKKQVKTKKRIVLIYKPQGGSHKLKALLREEYFVEEKRPDGKFRRIPQNAGPYATQAEADEVARDYSRQHPDVEVRVVAEL
ncbi:MAG: hypothetical protein J7578_11065 [Chitinophagaceae bacterium]|nr:hypothetical protein [Chitinophagaceae bacterium]